MCVRVINNLILQSFNPNIKFLRKYEIQVFKTKIFKRIKKIQIKPVCGKLSYTLIPLMFL